MATLKDIAELASVSITTASSILNIKDGEKRFSPDCVQRVRKVAKELGYKANYHYRSLRTGRSEVLGLAICAPTTLRSRLGWFRSQMVAGMMWACGDFGYELMIINDTDQASAVNRGLDHIRQNRIDGLVAACPVTTEPLDEVFDSDLPMVVCRYDFPTRLPCSGPNLSMAPDLIMDHFLELGHRNIACIIPSNSCSAPVATARFDEIKQWKQSHSPKDIPDLNFSIHRYGKWPVGWKIANFTENARKYTHKLLDKHPETSAILCWYELVAKGVYLAAAERGLTIPDDLSVACYYDYFAQHHHPPLTAISFRETEMCHRAAELLLNHLAEGSDFADLKGTRLKIEPALMVRNSTAKAQNPPK